MNRGSARAGHETSPHLERADKADRERSRRSGCSSSEIDGGLKVPSPLAARRNSQEEFSSAGARTNCSSSPGAASSLGTSLRRTTRANTVDTFRKSSSGNPGGISPDICRQAQWAARVHGSQIPIPPTAGSLLLKRRLRSTAPQIRQAMPG